LFTKKQSFGCSQPKEEMVVAVLILAQAENVSGSVDPHHLPRLLYRRV